MVLARSIVQFAISTKSSRQYQHSKRSLYEQASHNGGDFPVSDCSDLFGLRGASAGGLVTRYETDPIMGSTSIHSNFVSLVKEA